MHGIIIISSHTGLRHTCQSVVRINVCEIPISIINICNKLHNDLYKINSKLNFEIETPVTM